MMRLRSVVAAVGGLFCACVSTTLEPLVGRQAVPLTVTEAAPARVVWVLDNSGSMETPHEPAAASCGSCGPATAPCPVDCPTRKNWLVDWLEQQSLGSSQHAALLYPDTSQGNLCGGPSSLSWKTSIHDVADEWRAHVNKGGTPTAAALNFLVDTVSANELTDTYVVLVTDGVPNCNPENPNTCAAPAACRCTISACSLSYCTLGCLDDQGLLAASARLSAASFRLLVVGTGTGDTPDGLRSAPGLLSQMNIDLPPVCTSDAECAEGTACDLSTQKCAQRYYLATNAAVLTQVSKRLTDAVSATQACVFSLTGSNNIASDPLVVKLGGVTLQTSDFRLELGRRLRLLGSACDRRLADQTLEVEVSVLLRVIVPV